jgi:hypothetical protein
MDNALNGAKKYELWVHAGFTGHMKSTFAINWAYNQAVWYGYSSTYFSLEMPYLQVRNLFYAIHSAHRKFTDVRLRLGLQRDPEAHTVGLDYEQVRDGKLTPNAHKFLFDYVVPDFNGELVPELAEAFDPRTGEVWPDPSKYGKINIEVADPDKNDFTMADLRQRAELLYIKDPFRTIYLDHAGLMSPRKWVNSTTDRINEVIRDCKKLAMSFNRGQGIPVVSLFQINRQGFLAAQKRREAGADTLYDLTSLSYANECERSADIVTVSWLDDQLRNENKVLFQCLKSRDQKPFDMFEARVEWACRRIVASKKDAMTPQQKERVGVQLDAGKAFSFDDP